MNKSMWNYRMKWTKARLKEHKIAIVLSFIIVMISLFGLFYGVDVAYFGFYVSMFALIASLCSYFYLAGRKRELEYFGRKYQK